MEQIGSHWTDCHEIWYLRLYRKSAEKIQVLLKSDKNNGYFTWRPTNFFISYHAQLFLEWEMFQAKVVEKIKTHILCSVTFTRKLRRLWDINIYLFTAIGLLPGVSGYFTCKQNMKLEMWKKYGRDGQATTDNIIRRMQSVLWTTTVTDTHSKCVIINSFARQ